MATIPVTDVRKRAMLHPQVQAYWHEVDCGFPQVADVFEECLNEALSNFFEGTDRGLSGSGALPR